MTKWADKMNKEMKNKTIEETKIAIEESNTDMLSVELKIMRVFGRMCNFIRGKNRSYGNSVLNPIRLFSKADDYEQLMVRIDDKLSRLERGNFDIEDSVELHKDLMGYHALVLVKLGFGDEEV